MRRIFALVAVVTAASVLAWWSMPGGSSSDPGPEEPIERAPSSRKPPPEVRGKVVDAHGEPVAGAGVRVGDVEVTSGEEGGFEVRGLGAGQYEVDVEAAGYVAPGPKALRTVPVEIPEAVDERPARLELTLRRPATLAGRVVADGDPVEGARLTLFYRYAEGYQGGLEPFTLSSEGRTDEQGNFELGDVAPGRLHVMAEPPKRRAKQTSELLVESGDRIEGLEIDLAPQGAVVGRVTSEAGEPLAARVTLSGEKLPRDRTTTAGEDGRFRFETLPAADYRIEATASGHRAGIRPAVAVDDKGAADVEVTLAEGQGVFGRVLDAEGDPVEGAFVRFRGGDDREEWRRSDQAGGFQWDDPPGRVWSVRAFSPNHASSREATGRVGESVTLQLGAGGRLRGRVVDGAGNPVSGAKIGVGAMVVDGPRPYGNRTIERVEADEPDGTFVLGPLRPGRYKLRARAEGFASSSAPTVRIREGESVDSMTIVLGRGGTVRGRVQHESTGEAVAGATVAVFDMTSPFRPRRTETDKQGGFELDRVPAGRRSLRVEREGFLTRVLSGLQVGEGQTIVRQIDLHEKKKGERYGFRGIGASLRRTDEGPVIRNVMPEGGAQKQGLEEGDLIRSVDGEPVGDLPLPAVVQRIRGQAGEPVRLTVERDGRGQFDVEITRGRIVVDGRN